MYICIYKYRYMCIYIYIIVQEANINKKEETNKGRVRNHQKGGAPTASVCKP